MKVFIGIPHQGNIRAELSEYLWTLQKNNPDAFLFMHEVSPVDVNRNIIARQFLASDCDYLFWIDSDIVPPHGALETLLSANCDVTGALVQAMRGQDLITLLLKKKNKKFELVKPLPDQLQEVDATGFGCMLIKREVVQKLIDQDGYFCRFHYDKKGNVTFGEDADFCDRAQKLGYKIMIDNRVFTSHYHVLNMYQINLLASKLMKNV